MLPFEVLEFPGLFGEWGEEAVCLGRYDFVNYFRLKIEGPQGSGDDTALNAMNTW